MIWQVEYTDEFGDWWYQLSNKQQDSTTATVEMLMELGPHLRHPHSSGINGSKHQHMRELLIQSGGHPIRVFYAFDPLRHAILLIGGDKTGQDRFYHEYLPVADKLYDQHIKTLKQEGLIK